ncbi:MAG TPA: T9SS type A sorting domain-containing protein [Ignavibacteriales bacterium]|nr:T9SS type A sorting domain-containing protein [Ignavibacteriales bacterium]
MTSVVKLEIYDILGKHIQTLVNEVQNAGTYNINYSANNLPSGIYIAKLTANNYTKTIKMMLLK